MCSYMAVCELAQYGHARIPSISSPAKEPSLGIERFFFYGNIVGLFTLNSAGCARSQCVCMCFDRKHKMATAKQEAIFGPITASLTILMHTFICSFIFLMHVKQDIIDMDVGMSW